ADRHRDRGEVDVRAVIDVHPHERDEPGQRQPDEQDDRDDGIANRPCGDVTKVHWVEAWRPPLTADGTIRSPSLRKPPARSTIRALRVRPERVAVPRSVTARVVTPRRPMRSSPLAT